MRTVLFVLGLSVAPALVSAQVGHAPDRSPYRDLTKPRFVTLYAGQFGGSGGKVGVAPHDGRAYGARIDLLAANTVSLGFAYTQVEAERLIQFPSVPVASRTKGPVDQRLSMIEMAIQLNLTGKKTWRNLAPYAGVGLGVAFAEDTPADTSGYDFGTRLFLSPTVGVRAFVTRSLYLRFDASSTFWQVRYPQPFRLPPAAQPDAPPVLPDAALKEWTTSSLFRVGLGTAFSLPF